MEAHDERSNPAGSQLAISGLQAMVILQNSIVVDYNDEMRGWAGGKGIEKDESESGACWGISADCAGRRASKYFPTIGICANVRPVRPAASVPLSLSIWLFLGWLVAKIACAAVVNPVAPGLALDVP